MNELLIMCTAVLARFCMKGGGWYAVDFTFELLPSHFLSHNNKYLPNEAQQRELVSMVTPLLRFATENSPGM